MTTDGSGAFGTAHVASVSGAQVTLKWLVWASPPVVGTTLLVLSGQGRGQSRGVVGVGPSNGTLLLDRPLDEWVDMVGSPVPSVVAVVSSFGSKLIVANNFNWTEVRHD